MSTETTPTPAPTATPGAPPTLLRYFRHLPDPRRSHGQRHRLFDLVAIAICATIAGAQDWRQVALFGQRRETWLRRFLALPNGIPSHDTLERVFARLNPRAFHRAFQAWVTTLTADLKLKHLNLDGKTLRGSAGALGPLQVVSAWAREQHLVLGQVAVDGDSNEITAIPALLELLDLHGALVTMDAMGCQKAIVRQIGEQGGDYLVTVKANQTRLYSAIQDAFEKRMDAPEAEAGYQEYEVVSAGHGRQEKRTYGLMPVPPDFPAKKDWPDAQVLGYCYYEAERDGKHQEDLRYFIGSKEAKVRYYAHAYRGHWSIENQLHWHLDICFREDHNRVRERTAATNLALIRKMALMLLKRHPDQRSLASKRYAATLDTDFLTEVLDRAK
jgi:predicted transposase YbfD/YdcC